jgi:hypothetical protein
MMAFKKTTASMPMNEASEFKKASRPEAIAEAEGDGYAKTKPMQKTQVKGSKQFGLPKSGSMKAMKMKGC